ncbi:hypothetical protein ACGGZK_05655 [Agromyces sp. MMS24-K17]|uniref:hypothetical protein n=1 Tax=Agromyces sp. MMS24-K17 TaxID=3372850 RepID=UPI003754C8EF
MIRRIVADWWASPRGRRLLVQVGVVIGILMAVIGIFSARYGWLVAGLIVVVIAAASGPWRTRRERR